MKIGFKDCSKLGNVKGHVEDADLPRYDTGGLMHSYNISIIADRTVQKGAISSNAFLPNNNIVLVDEQTDHFLLARTDGKILSL